jgi:hypothetical protein
LTAIFLRERTARSINSEPDSNTAAPLAASRAHPGVDLRMRDGTRLTATVAPVAARGAWLNGFYRYDDEGVKAQKVSLVDRGELVGFFMGRNPIPGFKSSNGHGRHSPGLPPVARQGNLIVETTRSVPYADLERMLIGSRQASECRAVRTWRSSRPRGLRWRESSYCCSCSCSPIPRRSLSRALRGSAW